MMKKHFLALCLIAIARSVFAVEPTFQDVFVSGEGDYALIRTPQILVTHRGTLIVFAQGREGHHDQSGNDIILKRSDDDGKTWSDLQVIASDGDHSLNSICVLQLRESGRVLVVGCVIPKGYNIKDYQYSSEGMRAYMKRHGRDTWPALRDGYGDGSARTYVIHSDDDGKSWSPLRDITRQSKRPDALTCVPGPGLGIELRHGSHAGRIVIPCNHLRLLKNPKPRYENLPYAIYSDDGGERWEIGDLARPGDKHPGLSANEAQMVELNEGHILLNARTAARAIARSGDGGQTWSPLTPEPQLTGPACAAGLVRYDENRIIFSLPNGDRRANGTIWFSRDEGKTWPVSRTLGPDRFGYSCLARLPDGDIACVYGGRTTPVDSTRVGPYGIVMARVTMEWLED